MFSVRVLSTAAAFVLTASLVPTPSRAAVVDDKGISPSLCQPYAPDTTSAEIQVSPTGIYNPGTSIEKVICSLPRDAEGYYFDTEKGTVIVYYRVIGAAPGRLTCTVFVGTTSMDISAVGTVSGSGNLVSGGNRSNVVLALPQQTPDFSIVPNTLICAISPKTSMGAIFLEEVGDTDQLSTPS